MGRTRGGAVAAASEEFAAATHGDGWQFRGGARADEDGEVDPNYSYGLIEGVDPDIYDLCQEYGIEDRNMHKLHAIMSNRVDTFESDMLKLWDSVKNARIPSSILGAKMRDMQNGSFIGKAPKRYYSELPLKQFFKKQDIDNLCKDSLADALYDRRLTIIRERKLRGGGKDGDGFPEKDMREILDKLHREVDGSRNPSALVMKQIPAIEAGTGKWQGVGQVEKCKSAPVESAEELASKEALRVEDDKKAEKEGKVKRPKFPKQEAPAAAQQTTVLSAAASPLDSLFQQAAEMAKGMAESMKKKETPRPAFDSAELAKRLIEAKDQVIETSAHVEAPSPPQSPSSSPPRPPRPMLEIRENAVEPPPQPKRKMLAVKLSQKSVELVTKSGSAVSSGDNAQPRAKSRVSDDDDDDTDQMSDLQIASMALGRSIEELSKIPKDQLKAMIFAKMNKAPSNASGSRSPSPAERSGEDDEAEGMSELEMASIALRRPIEELRKLPQEELRSLVYAKMQNGARPGGSASRSPSASNEPEAVSRRSRSQDALPRRSQSRSRHATDDRRRPPQASDEPEKRRSRGRENVGKPSADHGARNGSLACRSTSRSRGTAARATSRESFHKVRARSDSRCRTPGLTGSTLQPRRRHARDPDEREGQTRGSLSRDHGTSRGHEQASRQWSASRSRSPRGHTRGRAPVRRRD